MTVSACMAIANQRGGMATVNFDSSEIIIKPHHELDFTLYYRVVKRPEYQLFKNRAVDICITKFFQM